MTHNINRLIRLLQQILEFRKAEMGKSETEGIAGDLVLFVRPVSGWFPSVDEEEGYSFHYSKQYE